MDGRQREHASREKRNVEEDRAEVEWSARPKHQHRRRSPDRRRCDRRTPPNDTDSRSSSGSREDHRRSRRKKSPISRDRRGAREWQSTTKRDENVREVRKTSRTETKLERRQASSRGSWQRRSRSRTENADLLFEMQALRCEVNRLSQRFDEMEKRTLAASRTDCAHTRSQCTGTVSAALLVADEAFLQPSATATGSGPVSKAVRARVCFGCWQPGHLKRKCPNRDRLTETMGRGRSEWTASTK